MLWIVAQFGVCRSLKHDKVLCDEQRKRMNKGKTEKASFMRKPLTVHKTQSLAS